MVRQLEGIEIAREDSPTANGHLVERTDEWSDRSDASKAAAESRCRARISTRRPLMAHAANHAADVITRFGRGKDGRTAWEPAHGKPYRREMLPFGGCCMCVLARGSVGRAANMDHPWRKGTFVGILKRSDGALVMTPEGAKRHDQECRGMRKEIRPNAEPGSKRPWRQTNDTWTGRKSRSQAGRCQPHKWWSQQPREMIRTGKKPLHPSKNRRHGEDPDVVHASTTADQQVGNGCGQPRTNEAG